MTCVLAYVLSEPRLEWHRYRRHIYRCRSCQRTCQGRGDLELPGAHIGPRARLLTCYSRAHLGISLGKTRDLLHDFFGLTVSRPGLLGHLRWGGQLFAPVVDELQELLQIPLPNTTPTSGKIRAVYPRTAHTPIRFIGLLLTARAAA